MELEGEHMICNSSSIVCRKELRERDERGQEVRNVPIELMEKAFLKRFSQPTC